MDEPIDPNDPAILDVTRRLEAYADERLSPTAAATTRMRTTVMNAALAQTTLTHPNTPLDATDSTTEAPTAGPAEAARRRWPRRVVATMAASLTLVILVGIVLGVQPGRPLYAVRIWTEMANLPAELVARAQAEVTRLDERLHEAQDASTASDAPATEAALVAYSTIVVEADKSSRADPIARATIKVGVSRHVIVLTLLVDTVPKPARAAVEQALSSTAIVLADLGGS